MKNAGPAGAFTGEKVDVADLIGPAVVIDLTRLTGKGSKGESPFIVPDDIKAWEKSNGAIGKGDIVLFYTGWDKYYLAGEAGKAYAYNPLVAKEGAGWPAPNADTALYLAERGVRCVGTDGTSMGSSHDGGPVHIVGLGKNLRYVEGLTNLGKLPARGAYFLFLPLKIAGSSVAPGRAVAFAPQK